MFSSFSLFIFFISDLLDEICNNNLQSIKETLQLFAWRILDEVGNGDTFCMLHHIINK